MSYLRHRVLLLILLLGLTLTLIGCDTPPEPPTVTTNFLVQIDCPRGADFSLLTYADKQCSVENGVTVCTSLGGPGFNLWNENYYEDITSPTYADGCIVYSRPDQRTFSPNSTEDAATYEQAVEEYDSIH